MNYDLNYQVFCGKAPENIKPLVPFDEKICLFLSKLSELLLKDKNAKQYPDVITFAFFIRSSNIKRLKNEYETNTLRIGRGLVFHIAPSNVPINFAYSLISALLAGNHSIVKASSKFFPQIELVCQQMQLLLNGEFSDLNEYIHVISYPREQENITKELSSRCDARMIWGGDQTIATIRRHATKPRTIDIPFADRYSLLVVDAQTICDMNETELKKVAQGFYNDTYLSDQNACTSPKLIYWLGKTDVIEKAKLIFWKNVHDYVEPRYNLQDVVSVDKLTASYALAMQQSECKIVSSKDAFITRVQVATLTKGIEECTAPGGFFVEYSSETLEALAEIITPKYQTLSYVGGSSEAYCNYLKNAHALGIDRVVPVGNTMDFSLTWDGANLIEMLSRTVTKM